MIGANLSFQTRVRTEITTENRHKADARDALVVRGNRTGSLKMSHVLTLDTQFLSELLRLGLLGSGPTSVRDLD